MTEQANVAFRDNKETQPSLSGRVRGHIANCKMRIDCWFRKSWESKQWRFLIYLLIVPIAVLYWPGLSSESVQGLATLFVGVGALETFMWNYRQKQEQFELKALEDEFVDILNRFASDDARMRASAALRLADIGKRSPHSRGYQKDHRFFKLAFDQLLISLHLEDNESVRRASVKAIKQMIDYAADHLDRVEHNELVNTIAEANRDARRQFADQLALYCATVHRAPSKGVSEMTQDPSDFDSDSDPLAQLAGKLRLMPLAEDIHDPAAGDIDPVKQWRCLYSVFSGPEVTRTYRLADAPGSYWHGKQILHQLCITADQMIDSAEGLSYSLVRLASAEFAKLKKEPLKELRLDHTYLSGCQLEDTILREADFNGSVLIGANFRKATVEGASFHGAFLHNADLQELVAHCEEHPTCFKHSILIDANLRNACLRHSDFAGAILTSVDAVEANFTDCKFNRSILNGADLNTTIFSESTITKSSFSRLQSCSDATFVSCKFDEVDMTESLFYRCNFSCASFDSCKISKDSLRECTLEGVECTAL